MKNLIQNPGMLNTAKCKTELLHVAQSCPTL